MPTFVHPTAAELREIAPVMKAEMEKNDPIFEMFPSEEVDATTVLWEQRDDYIGLAKVRPVNGQFGRVSRVGAKRFRAEAVRFGTFIELNEQTLEEKRPLGQFSGAIDITKETNESLEELIVRELNRDANLAWTLLATGTFSIADDTGAVQGTDTYPLQTLTISTGWSTYATATPIKDFETMVRKQRGYGVSFGKGAKAFMSRQTFQDMILNTNASDLAGLRASYGQTYSSMALINQLMADRDLPEIIVYDKGYKSDQSTYNLHIPYKSIVVVGKRDDGQPVGKQYLTRNIQNEGGKPGDYTAIIDTLAAGFPAPRSIRIERGKNSIFVVEYPGSVCVMSWT